MHDWTTSQNRVIVFLNKAHVDIRLAVKPRTRYFTPRVAIPVISVVPCRKSLSVQEDSAGRHLHGVDYIVGISSEFVADHILRVHHADKPYRIRLFSLLTVSSVLHRAP